MKIGITILIKSVYLILNLSLYLLYRVYTYICINFESKYIHIHIYVIRITTSITGKAHTDNPELSFELQIFNFDGASYIIILYGVKEDNTMDLALN